MHNNNVVSVGIIIVALIFVGIGAYGIHEHPVYVALLGLFVALACLSALTNRIIALVVCMSAALVCLVGITIGL